MTEDSRARRSRSARSGGSRRVDQDRHRDHEELQPSGRPATTPAGRFRIRLLGPVDIACDGEPVPVGSSQARTMLAALAVRAGQLLATDVLVEVVWGGHAPRTAVHALHVHASSLRKLAPCGLPVIGRRGGYVLQVGPGQLDTDQFEHLRARGRAELSSGDPARAAALLREALALWRGPALADVPWERFADGDARRWEELRHATEEDLIDAALAAGRDGDVVADAEALVHEQPFRERRWGQLMLALYRSGQQAAALDRYRMVRSLLAQELGIDPSPHLRRLEGLILGQDPSLTAAASLGSAPSSTTGTSAPWRSRHAPGRVDGGPADDVPTTRFARGPAGRLAYQVLGDGPQDLVFIPGFGGNVELRWEEPNLSRLFGRLSRSARLVLLDKRGTGLSDRHTGIPPVGEQVDDVLAVMDAAGSERAALLGVMDGGAIALLAGAAHPERVGAVVTYACFPAFELLGPDAAATFGELRQELEAGILFESVSTMATLAPSRLHDPAFLRWFGRYMRMAAGIGGAARLLDQFQQLDIRAALPRVGAPVLALHREHDQLVPVDNARYIAAHVQHGRSVILPGPDSVIWSGDVDAIAAEVEAFLPSD